MDWLTTLFVASLIVFVFLKIFRKSKPIPPGPMPLPFIGNLIYIARQDPVNFKAMHKISKKYGEVVTLKLGGMDNVSTCEAARDLYSRSDCLNRPINGALWERILHQNIGMAFSNDEGWSNIRKFTSKSLRDYGFGNRNSMQKLINQELLHLVEFIEAKVDSCSDGVLFFDRFFQASFLNLMSSMITGERHSYEDEELQKLIKASHDWFDAPILGVLTVMAFPWTRFVCPKLLGYEQQITAVKEMGNYSRRILEKRRQTKTFLEKPTCFADSFLKMAHESANDAASIFTDDQFAVLCTDLIQGGSDTTSNWMSFAILLLMVHQDVQEKVVKEIEQVIGFERTPESSDRDSMMYTQAVILEMYRYARLTVMMPPRKTTEEFYYKDHLIQKGTTILVNLHSCFMDPDVWGDPETFRPERFLNDDGQLVNAEKMAINFGAGRRICFGEPMAKESSFLYLATLLQKFSFHVPPNHPNPEMEPVVSIILAPKPYYVKIVKRI
ncbi:Methyl farnesoate epoxidase [Orchesella cincta]|uniref:Methyl farnesoate epoxidase n=1 Tax=Orchesella cincta TaxID=48709 RepID=A0A1D2NCV9_ORCCI|nr:Methyl farnesoate epoxidase [Orchesella cincta]